MKSGNIRSIPFRMLKLDHLRKTPFTVHFKGETFKKMKNKFFYVHPVVAASLNFVGLL